MEKNSGFKVIKMKTVGELIKILQGYKPDETVSVLLGGKNFDIQDINGCADGKEYGTLIILDKHEGEIIKFGNRKKEIR